MRLIRDKAQNSAQLDYCSLPLIKSQQRYTITDFTLAAKPDVAGVAMDVPLSASLWHEYAFLVVSACAEVTNQPGAWERTIADIADIAEISADTWCGANNCII
jgi:hypothetical protein